MGLISSIAGIVNNERNIATQKQFNQSQLAENERNRNFNANEAEKQRQFAEDFYERFESPSAMISQYRAAGLNPAMLMQGASFGASQGSNAASTGGSSAGSAPVSDPFGAIESLSRTENNIVTAKLNEARAEAQRLENDFNFQTFGLRKDQYEANLRSTEVQTKLNESNISVNEAKKASIDIDNLTKNLELSQKKELYKYVIEAARLDNTLKQANIDETNEAVKNLKTQRDKLEADIKQVLSQAALNDEERKYISENFKLEQIKTDLMRVTSLAAIMNASKGNKYGSIGIGKFKLSAGGTVYKQSSILDAASEVCGFEVKSPEQVKQIFEPDVDEMLNLYGNTD